MGALLGSLPKEVADKLLLEARSANEPTPPPPTAAEEVARVEAAVLHLEQGPPPENIFVPLTVVAEDEPLGVLKREPSPLVHWAHVDSGA